MAGNSRVRGVLRHKQMESEPKDKFEDLLVFGYTCKLFRDDEKASSIDQGSHLIPLMGDDSIKIDRYDVRGTLVDLKPLDVPQGGYDRSGLTAEERRVEALCDEERYFALYKDEAEEAVIKEEEIKRLNQDLDEVTSDEKSYHQVPFSYSNDQHVTKSSTPEAPVKSIIGELGDAIYLPPPALDVPPDMVVPPTRKLARVIEKTASFISSQGTQMEIIVKAKQANNPMFQFLHFDSALHPFYRHVQAAIRNGTYVIPDEDDAAESAEKDPPEKVNDNTNGQSNESDSENDNYLHPSLQPKVPDEPTPSAPKTEETSSMFPPTDLRPLLDKTASYMAKKGRHLEAVVLSKGDARFAFLKEDHNFHPYYIHKFTIYSEMHRNQQSAIMPAALQVPTNTIKSSTTTNNGDPDVVRSDRRKRAALFLDNIRRQKIPVSNSVVENGTAEDDIDAKSESTSSSSVKKSKSRSPADIEIIDARRPRERSLSRSPSSSSRKLRRSRSRQRSRSLSSVRSTGRIRGRSRSRSVHRRPSPSPERKRRHRKKHRSRDRHRKEKKRRRSRERSSRNKRSRRHRSRSGSRSSSGSRSPVLSRSTSRSPLLKSRSPSEPRRSPISTAVRKLATEASKSSSETSSPLPAQLLTVQPTFSKIAEGIRAKVIAMIEKDTKK